MSAAGPTSRFLPTACSGAMYDGVPRMLPVRVWPESPSMRLARPKSVILGTVHKPEAPAKDAAKPLGTVHKPEAPAKDAAKPFAGASGLCGDHWPLATAKRI